MKKIVFFLFVSIGLFFILISACKPKALSFRITGVVMDMSNVAPVNTGEVQLFEYPLGSQIGEFRGLIELKEDGSFEFEIERNRAERFELRYNEDGYFNVEKTIFFSELNPSQENFFTLHTATQSWVQLIIKNQFNPSPNDKLKILKSQGRNDCFGCCPNDYYHFNGIQDTIFECLNNGNMYFGFYYWVNGSEIFNHDSIFCTPFDTVTYEIIY